MEKIMKSQKGITLISLVVTIIILLILAGISIGMLSGDNGILEQAGNAKTQTDIAQEKEILQTATLAAIGKSKYGDITKEKLDNELNNYPEIKNTEQTDNGIVVTFKSNRAYLVNSDGDVSSYSDIKIGNLVVKDGNTTLAENCRSVQLGKALTINFEASIPGGSITSITPSLMFTTSGERRKAFTIVGKTSDGQEITKEYTVNLNGYYNIPDLKVGDFVNYTLKTPTAKELDDLNSDIATYSGATEANGLNETKIATGSTLLCRVLKMDASGNPTKLISANGVNSLRLEGADGYNNAVYLINEMCKTLYSGNQGTTTSLTIEDLENDYFSDAAIRKRDVRLGQVGYGETRYYSGNYAKYPNISPEEVGMGIATTLVDGKNTIRTGGLGLSQQTSTYTGSGDANASTVASTNKGITVTQTHYQIKSENSMYRSEGLRALMHLSSTYWLASRGVHTYWSICDFRVRSVSSDFVSGGILSQSNGESNSYCYAVRPIINLNSEIQAEYVEAYNNTYNIWNLN